VTTGNPSEPVSPTRRRRDPLPFLIAGVVLAVLAAIVCIAGSLVVIERQKQPPQPPPIYSPSPQPSARPTVPGTGQSGDSSGGPLGNARYVLPR
jgi:hypothetical protein